MSYHLLPNLILILAVFGILVIIVRRLPEVMQGKGKSDGPHEELQEMGLPASRSSRIIAKLKFWFARVWQFILEAKGLRPTGEVGYRIRKILKPSRGIKFTPRNVDSGMRSAFDMRRDEAFYLRLIKEYPKDLVNYSALGQFYLDNKNYTDAQNVYEYLVHHDPSNGNYYAKLAFCKLQLRLFGDAIIYYEKSITLDATHPNRFYNLSLAYKALGKKRKSRENLMKALQLEPESEKYKKSLEDMDQKSDTIVVPEARSFTKP